MLLDSNIPIFPSGLNAAGTVPKGINFIKSSVLYRAELNPRLPVLSNCFNSFLSESDNFFGSESQSQLGISEGLSPITSIVIPAIFAAISAFQTLGLGK